MKKYFLLILTIFTLEINAQDPNFSQFFNTNMYLNPAKTGALNGWTTNLHYRNQWPNLNSGGYQTANVGVQKSLQKYNSGIGINVINDNASNTIFTTQLGLLFAKRINITDHLELGLGANLEYIEKTLDLTTLTFGDMIDSRLGFQYSTSETAISSSATNINLSLGADFRFFNFDFGYTSSNINRPNFSFTGNTAKWPSRHTVYMMYKYNLNEKITLKPAVIYQNQSNFNTALFTLTAKYKFINMTVGIRNDDAMIFGGGVGFNRIRLQYTYDLTISSLSDANLGDAHEIGLVFRFGSKSGYDDYQGAY